MTFHSFDSGGNAAQRLRFALIASVLLHLLLLWPATARSPVSDGAAVLHAALRVPPAATAPPASRTVSRAAPPLVAKAPAPKPTETSVLEPARPAFVPQPGPAAVEKAVSPVSAAPAAASIAPPSVAPGTASGAAPGVAPATGAVLDGVRGYRLAVASQARRFKRYPAQAMAAGWAGSTEVRLEVGSDGLPRAAMVVRSSGHELLDQAALAMIDAGAQRARLPETLRGKAFAVVLPVVFNLEDE